MKGHHVVPQKRFRARLSDRPIIVNQVRLEMNIGLRGIICGELQKLRTLRRFCWATAVPIAPIDVPMTAEGLRVKEFWPHGRLAQSIAFLSPPGIERLYSGVPNSTASTSAIACLSVSLVMFAACSASLKWL